MEIVGYVTTAIVLTTLCVSFVAIGRMWFKEQLETKATPENQTPIPDIEDELDLNKRYDIVCHGDYSDRVVHQFDDVKILGYSGKPGDAYGSSPHIRTRWLVVEFADGRRAYLIPNCVVVLKQSVPNPT